MFLIQCSADKSLCIVKESQVICDVNVVKTGDCVTFCWKKKSYKGQILKRSEDHDFLAEQLKKIQRAMKIAKKSQTSQANESALGKRKSRKPTSFSPSDHMEVRGKKKMKLKTAAKSETKSSISQKGKKKKTVQQPKIMKGSDIPEKTIQRDSSDTSLTEDNTPDTSKENVENHQFSPDLDARASVKMNVSKAQSPTEEELKAMLKKYEKPEKSIENSELDDNCAKAKNGESKTSDLNHRSSPSDIDDDEAQLFGKNYAGEEMVHLQDGIYCRKKVYKFATGSSHLATHIARKLLEGVFKHKSLMQFTLTGQSARAQGKDHQIEVSSLHGEARTQ